MAPRKHSCNGLLRLDFLRKRFKGIALFHRKQILRAYGLDNNRLETLSDEVWWVRVQEMIRHNHGLLKLEDM